MHSYNKSLKYQNATWKLTVADHHRVTVKSDGRYLHY
jgi:hypothetical protein